jgi:hypothetical protein
MVHDATLNNPVVLASTYRPKTSKFGGRTKLEDKLILLNKIKEVP